MPPHLRLWPWLKRYSRSTHRKVGISTLLVNTAACLSVLGQNAEQEIVCEWLSIETFHSIFGSFASDEQVGTLHGSICPRCVNG